MLKHILLIITGVFLWSCGGGGENSSPTSITDPVVVNPPREVEINLPEKLVTNEKSTLKIDLSFTGSILTSDKVLLTANSELIVAQLNSDRNVITIDIADMTFETDVKIKVTVEGPSNTPSKETTVSITNVSANLFIQELNHIINKANDEFKYTEELHVANMLSLISPIKSSDIENHNLILKSFQDKLETSQSKINEKILQYRNAIKKYQDKKIDEIALRYAYESNDLSKSNYNLEKISALNKLLIELALPIEFPQNVDGTESNFIGNSKIGSYIGGQFFFNKNYYYLNSILDKSCIGGKI